jgi:hypothetical protein
MPIPSVGTPISTLPATISSPGLYVLTADLHFAAPTGAAITINADDVVLDLNEFTLSGKPAGPASKAVGILAVAHSELTIRNGEVTGFYNGVDIQGNASRGCLIERLFVYDVTYQGIRVEGSGHIVRGNRLLNITGNPDAASGGNGNSAAIGAYGAANTILNNDIVDVYGVPGKQVSFGTGINLNASKQSIVENNRLINRTFEKNSYGIFMGESTDVLVIHNRIVDRDMAITYSGGSTGAYRDNQTQACVHPYFGGTDVGGNH